MAEVGAVFLQTLRSTAGESAKEPGAAQAHERARAELAIQAIVSRAAEVWPGVALEGDVFARHLGLCAAAVRTPANPGALGTLGELHATDLYLACAAGHGEPAAVALFVQHFLAPIGAAVEMINRDPAFVDEVRQALHERLLVATDGPPRILQYGGRASLSTWVGVAAQRLGLGLLRQDGARQRAVARAAEEPLSVELDPELAYLKTRYRDAFNEALAVAIARLPHRQRTVLRLHAISGLTLARIAGMLMVDESTVSRWMQRARQTILEDAQRELGARLGMQVGEIPSLVRLVTSQLDVSVARLLSDDGGRPVTDHR